MLCKEPLSIVFVGSVCCLICCCLLLLLLIRLLALLNL